jgi:hypothetical protein
VSRYFRELVRTAETLVAKVRDANGLKPPKALRRRVHVKRVLKPKGEKA